MTDEEPQSAGNQTTRRKMRKSDWTKPTVYSDCPSAKAGRHPGHLCSTATQKQQQPNNSPPPTVVEFVHINCTVQTALINQRQFFCHMTWLVHSCSSPSRPAGARRQPTFRGLERGGWTEAELCRQRDEDDRRATLSQGTFHPIISKLGSQVEVMKGKLFSKEEKKKKKSRKKKKKKRRFSPRG